MPLKRPDHPEEFRPPEGHTTINLRDLDYGLHLDEGGTLYFYGTPVGSEVHLEPRLHKSAIFAALMTGTAALLSIIVIGLEWTTEGEAQPVDLVSFPDDASIRMIQQREDGNAVTKKAFDRSFLLEFGEEPSTWQCMEYISAGRLTCLREASNRVSAPSADAPVERR